MAFLNDRCGLDYIIPFAYFHVSSFNIISLHFGPKCKLVGLCLGLRFFQSLIRSKSVVHVFHAHNPLYTQERAFLIVFWEKVSRKRWTHRHWVHPWCPRTERVHLRPCDWPWPPPFHLSFTSAAHRQGPTGVLKLSLLLLPSDRAVALPMPPQSAHPPLSPEPFGTSLSPKLSTPSCLSCLSPGCVPSPATSGMSSLASQMPHPPNQLLPSQGLINLASNSEGTRWFPFFLSFKQWDTFSSYLIFFVTPSDQQERTQAGHVPQTPPLRPPPLLLLAPRKLFPPPLVGALLQQVSTHANQLIFKPADPRGVEVLP